MPFEEAVCLQNKDAISAAGPGRRSLGDTALLLAAVRRSSIGSISCITRLLQVIILPLKTAKTGSLDHWEKLVQVWTDKVFVALKFDQSR